MFGGDTRPTVIEADLQHLTVDLGLDTDLPAPLDHLKRVEEQVDEQLLQAVGIRHQLGIGQLQLQIDFVSAALGTQQTEGKCRIDRLPQLKGGKVLLFLAGEGKQPFDQGGDIFALLNDGGQGFA